MKKHYEKVIPISGLRFAACGFWGSMQRIGAFLTYRKSKVTCKGCKRTNLFKGKSK